MKQLKSALLLSVSLVASACVLEDETSLDPEADLDGQVEADPDSEPPSAAACLQQPPSVEATKTAVAPGVSQVAPSTSYWSSGDGAFTMHVNGVGSFANDPVWGRAQLQIGVPTSKSACERTFASAVSWGRNKNTGCWSLLSGATTAGKWTQDVTYPFTSSYCTVRTDTADIDGSIYTQVRVSTSAYRNETFPIPITLPLQVTAILVIQDT